MSLRINSLQDVAKWSPEAKAALLNAGVPDVPPPSGVSGRYGEYKPLTFQELRKEEAATLIAVYRKIQDLDDGSAPERPQQLINEALEIIEARLAEISQ